MIEIPRWGDLIELLGGWVPEKGELVTHRPPLIEMEWRVSGLVDLRLLAWQTSSKGSRPLIYV